MNFRQAYDGWSQQEENRQLYMKTKDAFRKAWFNLPTNKPCSYYTKEVLGEALSQTRVIDSMKVNAASIAVHVLAWANWAEPKWNPKPDFTMDDLMKIARRPKQENEEGREPEAAAPAPPAPVKEKGAGKAEPLSEDDTDLDIDPVTAMPRKAMAQENICRGCNNVKGCITCHNGSEWAHIVPVEDRKENPLEGIDFEDPKEVADALMEQSARIMNDKPEDNMSSEKKRSGRAPIPVAQLDPETLKVVWVWPSRSEAERETGACNIDRAIQKLRKAAGSYWCKPEDAEVFASKLKEKQKAKPKKKAVKKGKPAAKKERNSGTEDTCALPLSEIRQAERSLRIAVGLEIYTDQQLKDELVRRGWRGKLSRMEELLLE